MYVYAWWILGGLIYYTKNVCCNIMLNMAAGLNYYKFDEDFLNFIFFLDMVFRGEFLGGRILLGVGECKERTALPYFFKMIYLILRILRIVNNNKSMGSDYFFA